MSGIDDWQAGWTDVEAFLDELEKKARTYEGSSNAIGNAVIKGWVDDLVEAKKEAAKNKVRPKVTPIVRALSFEETKLLEWAENLDGIVNNPKTKGFKRYVARAWRDTFNGEAELRVELLAALDGVSVTILDGDDPNDH